MIELIETNISLNSNGELADHQSRVIEVDSWDKYMNDLKECKPVHYDGTMVGFTVPRQSQIENLKYDKSHASCTVTNYCGDKTLKLVYKINKTGEPT